MKFSIRDLMFVTVIVALLLGWSLDRSRIKNQLAKELQWRSRLMLIDVPVYSGDTPYRGTKISKPVYVDVGDY
jgi:hypothetical protein